MNPIRLITATALYDGHDVSINLFRRLFQKAGCEVIHLGHSRSVAEVVSAAVEEDADAVLVSSYQGGHNEYYQYLVRLLRERGAGRTLVFGGGGGVILPSEIKALEAGGVERIYHADEGRRLGVEGVVRDVIDRIRKKRSPASPPDPSQLHGLNPEAKDRLARLISFFENNPSDPAAEALRAELTENRPLILGVTGTGGSGKSSLTDELVSRFLKVSPDIRIAVLAVDPSRSTTGGALLGDRIRMNAVYHERVFLRSFATRNNPSEISPAVRDAMRLLGDAGYHLVIVETSGIGQRDHAVKEVADLSLYVMTSEYGAPSQLEKIDMLELADFTALNKCRRPEAEDAFREILLHHVRSRNLKTGHTAGALFKLDVPVYATEANEFNNSGVNHLFHDLLKQMAGKGIPFTVQSGALELLPIAGSRDFTPARKMPGHALHDIAETVEKYHARAAAEAVLAEQCQALKVAASVLPESAAAERRALDLAFQETWNRLAPQTRRFLETWPETLRRYAADGIQYSVRDNTIRVAASMTSLSGLRIPKVALPRYSAWGELVRFFHSENLPGYYPFTAGVFPFKSTAEDPKRQFAGEGTPEKTNRRLHFLSDHDPSKRLSIAFDPLTLYGENPVEQPDAFGKIGESGVSIATLDDMKTLFEGFDLADPRTSVSMTINGPAPVMLALYFITAAAQREKALGRPLDENERHNLFRGLRGTVQADVLKEDQSQNTCIFSMDFALRLLGDVQRYFTTHKIRNYYTLSISGYHIAEAGANPVTQLAFTLANGFHYVEHFLALGLPVDGFAHNLSFFFSNGLEPEYSVLGRVARRIWAIALKERYGAEERAQKLKYHIQTSGRSLHAQEIELNDVRTTLQALLAYYDNCNSLHTNAYDEAVTTPTEESVRRAMAIQLIVSREFGMTKNENPLQGAFIFEELTELVEKAVLAEFRKIAARGGVLGAMEKQYQRSRIQEESLLYEELKHSGKYPIVGVNTFVRDGAAADYDRMEVRRATAEEKKSQLARLAAFETRNAGAAGPALERLRKTALSGGNIFEELLNAVNFVSLGKIVRVLYDLGGQYRRNL